MVWKARPVISSNTDSNPTKITLDFPQEILARCRRLIPILLKAKSMDKYKESYLRDDKLYIDGKTYTVDTLEHLPDSLDAKSIATKSYENLTMFWGQNSPLSNHHPTEILIDGTLYNCVEQYYTHSMAVHAGDFHRADTIMSTTDPVIQKHTVKGMKTSADWNDISVEIMRTAITAKFTQNADLKYFLLQTGTTDLVEASPHDNFWGAGLSMDSPDIVDKSKWKGKNMLGKLLTTLRNSMRENS